MSKSSLNNILLLLSCSHRHGNWCGMINQRSLFQRTVSLISMNGHLAWFPTLRIVVCVMFGKCQDVTNFLHLHTHLGLWQVVNLPRGCPWTVNSSRGSEGPGMSPQQIKIEGGMKYFCHPYTDTHTHTPGHIKFCAAVLVQTITWTQNLCIYAYYYTTSSPKSSLLMGPHREAQTPRHQ